MNNCCCICLASKKSLRLRQLSQLDAVTSMTYHKMIVFLIDVKVHEAKKNNICLTCINQLKAAYKFKNIILGSQLVPYKDESKVYFNTMEELKGILQIEDMKPSVDVLAEGFENTLSNNNVTIKRVTVPKKEIDENKIIPVPVLDFLSIVEDIDDHVVYDEPEPADNFLSSSSDDDYSIPLAERKSKTKNVKKTKQNLKNGNKECVSGTGSDTTTSSDEDFIPIKRNKNENYTKLKLKKKYDRSVWKKIKHPKIRIKPVIIKNLKLLRTKKTDGRSDPGICPYCGLAVKCLDVHLRIHTEKRNVSCPKCQKKFYNERELSRHDKSVHLSGKRFNCGQCVAAFCFACDLKAHMTVHSEEKNHVCSMCKKAFKRKAHLLRHEMMHSGANKRMTCEECGRSFLDRSHLRHHMRVHTGERPFRCELCNQPYSYKYDFARHCLKKHGVFLLRRKINFMNKQVLQREKQITADLVAVAKGRDSSGVLAREEFQGPHGVQCFNIAMKHLVKKEVLKYCV